MKEEQFWEIVEKPLPKRPLQTADPRNNAYNLAYAPCSHVQSVQGAPTAPPLSHSPSLLFHPISAPSHLLLFLSCSGSRSPLQAPYHILHCNACSSCLHYYTRRGRGREGPREREAVPAFHTLRSSKFYRIEAIRVDRPTGADRASFQTVLGLIDVGRGREMDIEASGPAGLHSLPCQIAHLYSLKQ